MKKIKNLCALFVSSAIIACCCTMNVSASGKKVILGGQPFGVKFYNDGVIVTELEPFYDGKASVCPFRDGGVRVNDVIKAADGVSVFTNEELIEAALNSGGRAMELKISRDGKEISKTVTPKQSEQGRWQLGGWVKDSCAGIGTVTFYDSGQNYFAALGHGICDNDTHALLPLKSAEILGAEISSVTKSSVGNAGSLNGFFTETTLGTLSKNTENGVFGNCQGKFDGRREIEIAENGEIHTGKAELVTTIEGEKPQSYEAEITRIRSRSKSSNENFVIKVTDRGLLESCGGIVQGMSGSPVVQDGKLVGAVTHVFMNDPTEGYGVTAQNMVSKYDG